MADLPISGIALIVSGAQQAVSQLKLYQNALNQQKKTVTNACKSTSCINTSFSSTSSTISSLMHTITSSIPRLGSLTSSLTGAGASAGALTTALGGVLPVVGAVAVAIGGLTTAFIAFWKAGERGAELQNTLEAFKNAIAGLEDTDVVLNGLRKATRGTVSDMELMRLTVQTLQGQSNEFRQVLLKTENGVANLGKVLDVTARAARATGQSEEYIREKFLMGLRLQSKLRLDDIGVTVNAVDANEKYAKSINKAAAALTDAEKKQAFLNEALRQLDRIGAEAPINSVQDAISRMSAQLQNLKDKVALLIQPIFAPVSRAISGVFDMIVEDAHELLNLLKPIFDVIGSAMTTMLDSLKFAWSSMFGEAGSQAKQVMPYIIASFQLWRDAALALHQSLAAAFRAFIGVLSGVRNAVGKVFGGVGDDINLNINQLAFNLGKGGAFIIGSFAAGILKAGTYVAQAVTAIAQIVADFLVGFSPPKKGPLSNIDKGGENVATSWVDGFIGGVKSSFGQVTAYVNERLGAIAKLSREQVEARLAMLDVALRPFRENLAIVKADMEAIAGFTDPALRIMERQRKNLLKAFGEGKVADIEQLRNLDRQIQRMKELKEFGQDQVDQAELQLALASSQQAQERALLQIMKDRLGAAEKAGATGKEAGAGGGGSAETGAGADAGLGLGGGVIPDLFSTEGIDAAKAAIVKALAGIASSGAAGISEGLADSGFSDALSGFTGQGKELSSQLGRIAKSNPVQAIADKFAGLKDAVTGAFTEFKDFIYGIWKDLFSDPDGTISRFITTAKNTILSAFSEGGVLGVAKTAFDTFKEGVESAWKAIFSDPDGIVPRLASGVGNIIENIFSGEGNPLQTALDTLDEIKTQVGDIFDDIFELDLASASQTIYDVIKGVFDDLKIRIDAFSAEQVITDIKNAIKGVVEDILSAISDIIPDDIVGGFVDVLDRIKGAIESFPTDTINKALTIGQAAASIVSGLLSGGGEGEELPALEATPVLNLELPEELSQQLQILGANITGAIATGMKSDDLLPITEALGEISTRILNTFSIDAEGSPLLLAQGAMAKFVTNIGTSLSALRDTMSITLDKISTMLTNVFVSETGAISQSKLAVTGMIDSLVNDFLRLTSTGDGTLSGALQNMRGVLRSTLVIPVHEAAQAAANAIINALNGVIDQYNGLGLAAAPSINRLTPIFMQPPSFAKGTLGYNKPFIAGEKGEPELVMPSRNNPLSVFPGKATSALTAIAGMMNKPAPQPQFIPIANNGASQETNNVRDSYNTQKNVTFNSRYRMSRLEMLQLASRS